MRNIVVVSMNRDLAVLTAEKIANMLSLTLINADDNLDERLMKSLDFPLDVAHNSMSNIERNLLLDLSNRDNSVIAMSDNIFLANGNSKIFKKSLKILVKIDKNEKITNSLQNLLEKYCDVTLSEKNIDFDKLITLLRG